MLTEQQIEFFHANGYLVVENAVSAEQLDALRADFGGWVEESRQHQDGWGETVNGKARFDVEKGHNAEKPALRRINAPHEVSDAFFDVMSDSAMTGCETSPYQGELQASGLGDGGQMASGFSFHPAYQ